MTWKSTHRQMTSCLNSSAATLKKKEKNGGPIRAVQQAHIRTPDMAAILCIYMRHTTFKCENITFIVFSEANTATHCT